MAQGQHTRAIDVCLKKVNKQGYDNFSLSIMLSIYYSTIYITFKHLKMRIDIQMLM